MHRHKNRSIKIIALSTLALASGYFVGLGYHYAAQSELNENNIWLASDALPSCMLASVMVMFWNYMQGLLLQKYKNETLSEYLAQSPDVWRAGMAAMITKQTRINYPRSMSGYGSSDEASNETKVAMR